MKLRMVSVGIFFLGLHVICFGTREARSQTLVSFETEDGWTIGGALFVPDPPPRTPVPGVVFVGTPGDDLSTAPLLIPPSNYSAAAEGPKSNPNAELQRLGMTSLFIDMRGRGRSMGPKDVADFSDEDHFGYQLDIRAAIRFLTMQKNIDPRRIAVVAGGGAAHYAVLEAAENPDSVQALVLSGPLGQDARDYIGSRERLPLYFLADPTDKASLRDLAEAYFMTKNRDSVFALANRGIQRNRARNPDEGPEQWLFRNLVGLGAENKVSFQTSDGWTLHGRLRVPPGVDQGNPVAGVVLVHGARHDQGAFHDLARDLARGGLAVLTYDWRGMGESADDQKWFSLDLQVMNDPQWIRTYGDGVYPQMTKIYLDVKAATEFLASRPGVDPNRIGLLGATWGTDHVIKAAIGDSRIKSLALLSPGGGGGVPESEMTEYLKSSDTPVLLFSSEEDVYPGGLEKGWVGARTDLEVARKLYFLSRSKHSQLIVYERGAHGSSNFSVQPEQRPTIVRWFQEKLGRDWLNGPQ